MAGAGGIHGLSRNFVVGQHFNGKRNITNNITYNHNQFLFIGSVARV